MRTLISKGFIALSLIASISGLSAQDMAVPKQVISRINAFYDSRPTFRHQIAYNLYKDHQSNELIDSDTAIIVRSGKSVWFQMNDVETLSDGVFELMVNHTDQVIVVSDYQPKLSNPLAGFGIDSLLMFCTSYLSDTYGEIGCLYLAFEASEAKGISICYRLSDYSLYSLTTYYNQERKVSDESDADPIRPRLEIRYLHADYQPKLDVKRLRSDYFIRRTGKTLSLSAKFQRFQLFNQTLGFSNR